MKGWRMMVAAAAVAVSLSAPRPARADYAEDAGWGVLTVLANVVYMPVKTVYATLGGITGGLAYACTVGDFETASNIWQASLGGTYVLTPSMVRGEDPIAFAGNTAPTSAPAASDSATNATAAAPAPATPPATRSRREESLPSS